MNKTPLGAELAHDVSATKKENKWRKDCLRKRLFELRITGGRDDMAHTQKLECRFMCHIIRGQDVRSAIRCDKKQGHQLYQGQRQQKLRTSLHCYTYRLEYTKS